jgi:hypothetical protein
MNNRVKFKNLNINTSNDIESANRPNQSGYFDHKISAELTGLKRNKITKANNLTTSHVPKNYLSPTNREQIVTQLNKKLRNSI